MRDPAVMPGLRSVAIAFACAAGLCGVARAAGGDVAFQALDANRDGHLSREELRAHARLLRSFDAIDTNHDGRLSNDELQAWRGLHLHKAGSEGKAFTALDLDGDGRVERSELPPDPHARAWFDGADRNRDGVVTKEEARAAREAAVRPEGPGRQAAAQPR